nr:YjfA family protein [Streptomyces sp. NBC_00974]
MRISTMIKRTAVVAVATAALGSGFASTASAAAYDGQDPISSGCSASAITAASTALYANGARVGTVELRYSTSCRTTWVRVYSNGPNLGGYVNRNQDGATQWCGGPSIAPNGQYSCFSPMLNDAGYTSYAAGRASDSSGSYDSGTRTTSSY